MLSRAKLHWSATQDLQMTVKMSRSAEPSALLIGKRPTRFEQGTFRLKGRRGSGSGGWLYESAPGGESAGYATSGLQTAYAGETPHAVRDE